MGLEIHHGVGNKPWGWNCIKGRWLTEVDMGFNLHHGVRTTPFLGAHKWAELLRNPCILPGPQRQVSRVPNAKRGEKIRIGYLTPAFGGPELGGIAT